MLFVFIPPMAGWYAHSIMLAWIHIITRKWKRITSDASINKQECNKCLHVNRTCTMGRTEPWTICCLKMVSC